jgi:hypothetical protein
MKNFKQKNIAIIAIILTIGLFGCGEKKQSANNLSPITCETDDIIVVIEEADYKNMESDTCWINAIEDSISVEIGSLVDSTNKIQKPLSPDNILRVEGVASIGWKGVSGCCGQNTVNNQAKKAIEAWVGKQILANRPHQYYRSGLVGQIVNAKCKSKNPQFGARSCKGSWKQPYFIEFIKQ